MLEDIYQFVLTEKNNYENGVGVPVAGNWIWSMFKHCEYTLLMKNGQFPITQTQLGDKPYKNIILPVLNVAYRSEGFDVKDIEVYVDDEDNYHLSLLARKFHNRWALKWGIDGFIDDVVENLDYGFVLVKNVNNERPEVIDPKQIAFCDQTNLLAGAIGIKHEFSIDELNDMTSQGWYAEEIDRAIRNAKTERQNQLSQGLAIKTPSKNITVYEVHGTFSKSWLQKDGESYNEKLPADEYSRQMHIVTYVDSGDGTGLKNGICLFKGNEGKNKFKVLVVNKIYGRAAGRGRVEELFEPQIWINFNVIAMENMLREASKVIQVTTDAKFTTRNNTKNARGGEVWVIDDNKTIYQLNTVPMNFALFDRAAQEWETFGQKSGRASDPSLGITPVSGTPLGTTQIITNQEMSGHEYVRGKIAAFVEEIYRDWVVQYLIDEMNEGDKWMDELEMDELQELAEKVSVNASNNRIKEMVLSGKMVSPEEQAVMLEVIKEQFKKGGRKRFFKIMKDEFKKLPIKLKINVANKQKELSRMSDKMTNVFQAIFSNPQGFIQTMQIPEAAKAFNQMLEYSGMEQFDWTKVGSVPSPMQMQPMQLPTKQNANVIS